MIVIQARMTPFQDYQDNFGMFGKPPWPFGKPPSHAMTSAMISSNLGTTEAYIRLRGFFKSDRNCLGCNRKSTLASLQCQ